MKGMKSSKVDYLEKKVANLEKVLSHLFTEQQRITELAVGTLETLPDKMGVFTYMLAGILSLPQVFVAKQWNLVLVNLNVAIAYTILYLS